MRNSGLSTLFGVVLVVLATVHSSNADLTARQFLNKLAAAYKASTRHNRNVVAADFAKDADATLDDVRAADPNNIEAFIDVTRLRLGRVLKLVDGGLWDQIHLARKYSHELRDRVAVEVAAIGRGDNALDNYYLDDLTETVKTHAKLAVGAWRGIQSGYLQDLETTYDEVRRIAAGDAYAFAAELKTLWKRTLEVLRFDLDAKFSLSDAFRRIVVKRSRTDVEILLR